LKTIGENLMMGAGRVRTPEPQRQRHRPPIPDEKPRI